jgi:hypothetical protein
MLVYRAHVRWEGSNVALVSTGHAPPSAADDRGERRRCGRRPHQRAGAAARAGRSGEAWRAASGLGRAVLFGPTGPSRCDDRNRGDQRGGRHQGAGGCQDRACPRRRAIDAGRRQCRGREDEFGERRGHHRRLCQLDLPHRQPDRRPLRPALRGRRRGRRQHRHARPQEHVPVRARLRSDRSTTSSSSTTRPASRRRR